jgi:quinol monooxygenase YgiN
MYGTVAKLRLKPGMEAKMKEFSQQGHDSVDGIVFQHLYRLDDNPQDLMLVVGFASKDAYQANAASPDQHARYEEYRAMLEADPEWHDGEIIFSQTNE